MPVVSSTAKEVPGAAPRRASTTLSAVTRGSGLTWTNSRPVGGWSVECRSRAWRSTTAAPFAQMARPWPWTWSLTTPIQRAGRPVTKNTAMPASSAAARAATVRSETDLSSRSKVPSRSVAMSRVAGVGPSGHWGAEVTAPSSPMAGVGDVSRETSRHGCQWAVEGSPRRCRCRSRCRVGAGSDDVTRGRRAHPFSSRGGLRCLWRPAREVGRESGDGPVHGVRTGGHPPPGA